MPLETTQFINRVLPELKRSFDTQQRFVLTTGGEPFQSSVQTKTGNQIHLCACNYAAMPVNFQTSIGSARHYTDRIEYGEMMYGHSKALYSLFDFVDLHANPGRAQLVLLFVHKNEFTAAWMRMLKHRETFPNSKLVMICHRGTLETHSQGMWELACKRGTVAEIVVTSDTDGRYVLGELIGHL
jgi:hypothetical protein